MMGDDELLYQRLLNFEACNYSNIISSQFKDLMELLNFRHSAAAIVPDDAVSQSGQLADFLTNLGLYKTKVHRVDNHSEAGMEALFNAEGTLASAFKEAASEPDVRHYMIINGDFGAASI